MSRELRILAVAIFGVIALYFAIGAMLPTGWSVESSVRLAAPPAAVLPQLVDFGQWQQWSSVSATVRPNTAIEVEGEPGTAGHRLVWRSGANEAMLRLLAVKSDTVEYEFLARVGAEAPLQQRGLGTLRLTADGDGSVLTWRDQSTADSFAERWFAWFGAQQEAARQFQQTSLTNLRLMLEGR